MLSSFLLPAREGEAVRAWELLEPRCRWERQPSSSQTGLFLEHEHRRGKVGKGLCLQTCSSLILCSLHSTGPFLSNEETWLLLPVE